VQIVMRLSPCTDEIFFKFYAATTSLFYILQGATVTEVGCFLKVCCHTLFQGPVFSDTSITPISG
jgi:hypothetical protein